MNRQPYINKKALWHINKDDSGIPWISCLEVILLDYNSYENGTIWKVKTPSKELHLVAESSLTFKTLNY